MKTDFNTLNLSTLGDMGLYVHIPFCKQKCMYCDFPAYQNLQDYYETYVFGPRNIQNPHLNRLIQFTLVAVHLQNYRFNSYR